MNPWCLLAGFIAGFILAWLSRRPARMVLAVESNSELTNVPDGIEVVKYKGAPPSVLR